MPIYEYRCKSCGHTVEVIQRLSDRPLRKCAECQGDLEKLVSRSSFQLKGGGWFINDYSHGKSASKASAKEGTDSKSSSTSSPKKNDCSSGGCSCSE